MYRHNDREMVVVSVHLQGKLWNTRIREGNGQEMCKVWGSQTSAQKVSIFWYRCCVGWYLLPVGMASYPRRLESSVGCIFMVEFHNYQLDFVATSLVDYIELCTKNVQYRIHRRAWIENLSIPEVDILWKMLSEKWCALHTTFKWLDHSAYLSPRVCHCQWPWQCFKISSSWIMADKYINNQQMLFSIYDVFYSQCSHQHVAAGILAIFRMMLLLQEYECTNLVKYTRHLCHGIESFC